MTADTPAASKDAPTDEAVKADIEKIIRDKIVPNDPPWREPHIWYARDAAEEIYAAHIATLTEKLEAERAETIKAINQGQIFKRERDNARRDRDRETARADAAVAEAKALREMLRECAAQFLFYERQHRAKGTPEADKKAEVNKAIADRIRATLAQPAAIYPQE